MRSARRSRSPRRRTPRARSTSPARAPRRPAATEDRGIVNRGIANNTALIISEAAVSPVATVATSSPACVSIRYCTSPPVAAPPGITLLAALLASCDVAIRNHRRLLRGDREHEPDASEAAGLEHDDPDEPSDLDRRQMGPGVHGLEQGRPYEVEAERRDGERDQPTAERSGADRTGLGRLRIGCGAHRSPASQHRRAPTRIDLEQPIQRHGRGVHPLPDAVRQIDRGRQCSSARSDHRPVLLRPAGWPDGGASGPASVYAIGGAVWASLPA